ncbi:PKD domain-containing protein [Candidatus Nitrosotenuis cloacae]|uniref:PKD domain-containing protein n=1 Tax=Candidatus Nitrosotenuis cloacae TaxID=1603555 RepID=UPI00228182AD|nr:PKD domain-containing protein [Candidatus Nitrosotenuis cloacae]
MVGFVVDGPTIADRKAWHFGDGVVKKSNNLIYEHRYENPGTYRVWVDLIDKLGNVIENGESKAKTVTVTAEPQRITSFTQRKCVVTVGEYVIFAMSHDIEGRPLITWKWGDGTPDLSGYEQNPHHKYEREGTWEGTLIVQGDPVPTVSRKFAVLVLASPFQLGGRMDVLLHRRFKYPSEMPMPPKKKLTFIADSDGGNSPIHYSWDFNDRSPYMQMTGNRGNPVMFNKGFDKPGDYLVTLTITDDLGYEVVITKDVIIREDGKSE